MDFDRDVTTTAKSTAPAALPDARRRLGRSRAVSGGADSQTLLTAFFQLEGDERTLLVRIIAQVARLEREQGEDVALAMLESALARMGLTSVLS